MSKAFEKMKAGLEDALAYAQGTADKSKYRIHVPAQVDVKEIRTKMGMSQDEFAQRFSFTSARIKDWEQGRSKPDSAARAYLIVIMKDRGAVEQAFAGPIKGHSSSTPKELGRRIARKPLKEINAKVAGARAEKLDYGLRSEPKTGPGQMIVAAHKRGGTRKQA